MSRRNQRPSYTPVPDDELSLESILAEYGKGGRQPAPKEAPPEPAPAPAPEPDPIPVAEPGPEPLPPPVPDPAPLSDTPDRVSLKDVMSQTVDAVLEDEEDGVIDDPVPLGQRLSSLLHRFTDRRSDPHRGLSQETEQLFDDPEEPSEPEEPEEPEPRMDDALRE